MQRVWLPPSRAEGVIAGTRIGLSAAALLAVYAAPTDPGRYASLTWILLASYFVYSLALGLFEWRHPVHGRYWALGNHVVDLLFFSVIIFLTEGPGSPFFAFFVFSVFCATVRFSTRGTVATTAAALGIFVSSAAVGHVYGPGGEQAQSFIIRTVYLIVIAVFLIFLSRYHEALRRDIARLASWPPTEATEERDLMRDTLPFAGEAVGSNEVVAVWQTASEQHEYSVSRRAGEWTSGAGESVEGDQLLARPALLAFTSNDLSGDLVLVETESGSRTVDAAAYLSGVHRRDGCLIAQSFGGEGFRGQLLFFRDRPAQAEDLMIAGIATRLVSARIEQLYHLRELKSSAVMGDRIRVGRDLHDWLLQSLTGAALQLQTLHKLILRDPEAAQVRLAEAQEAIAHEQRELRRFIDGLRDSDMAAKEEPRLGERLDGLRLRIQEQWGATMALHCDPLAEFLSKFLRQEIYSLAQEAVANSVKHGAASELELQVRMAPAHVTITAVDNGIGFPFRGHYDLRKLNLSRRGPVTLKERIASLGGDLSLTSTEAGCRIVISLPTSLEAESVD